MAKEVNKDNKDKEVKVAKKAKNNTKKSSKKDTSKQQGFFKDFKAELKRVSWPTFKQLVNNTSAVIAIVLIVAIIVFVLDVIFENLNNLGVEKLKAIVTSSSSEVVETEGSGDENKPVTNDASSDEATDENATEAKQEAANEQTTTPDQGTTTEASGENNSSVQ